MKAVKIAHASRDEKKTYSGGKAGDQDGLEVCIRAWFNRPWNVVLRLKNTAARKKVAYAMEAAAQNDHIGYDQGERNTLLSFARKVGYDPARVTADCETDCSALVSVACMYAGIPEEALYKSKNSATTRTLRARLAGYVTEYISKTYTEGTDKLEVGDILLYEGHHVAVVVSAEPVAEAKPAAGTMNYVVNKGDSLWTIAKQFLGNGALYGEIVKLNKLTTTNITPGQVLAVPKK